MMNSPVLKERNCLEMTSFKRGSKLPQPSSQHKAPPTFHTGSENEDVEMDDSAIENLPRFQARNKKLRRSVSLSDIGAKDVFDPNPPHIDPSSRRGRPWSVRTQNKPGVAVAPIVRTSTEDPPESATGSAADIGGPNRGASTVARGGLARGASTVGRGGLQRGASTVTRGGVSRGASTVGRGLSRTYSTLGQVPSWKGSTAAAKPKVPLQNTNLKKTQSMASLHGKGTDNARGLVNAGVKRGADGASGSSEHEVPVIKKPRAKYDLKGRVEDLEDEKKQWRSSQKKLMERMAALEAGQNHYKSDGEFKSVELVGANRRVSELTHELRETRLVVEEKTTDLQRSHRKIEDLTIENEAARNESKHQRLTISQQRNRIETLEVEGQAKELESTKCKQELQKTVELNLQLNQEVQRLHAELLLSKQKILQGETERRKLHNAVQELKGNIRVFCRVRPLLPKESDKDVAFYFPHVDNKEITIVKQPSSSEGHCGAPAKPTTHTFKYDRVFEPTTTQAEVFEEVSQLVQSLLDGYNICIFAYGQTGSGKTHTMEGPECSMSAGQDSNAGVIPRAVEQIWKSMEDLEAKGWQYKLEASFIEIYNEALRDLLIRKTSGAANVKLQIKNSEVEGLTTVTVGSPSEIYKLLRQAQSKRSVAATLCNENSSRSHYVFRLHLTGHNKETAESCKGVLNLVDLAGSERLKESGSQGDRLTETTYINNSLTYLTTVIFALANKEGHIPYRNSTLTQLLKNSLGGNSKTLMLVNVAPRADYYQETLNSLRIATRVNKCQIGVAQTNGAAKPTQGAAGGVKK